MSDFDTCIRCHDPIEEGRYCSPECKHKTENYTAADERRDKRHFARQEQELRNAVDAAIDAGEEDVACVVPNHE